MDPLDGRRSSLLLSTTASRWKREEDRDERIILHFDYDCFYAQVFENRQPALRSRPLGVRQKSILATCNYVARRRGVRKLMGVAEARRTCPHLVLVDGEDLTPFRDASKHLYALLRRSLGGMADAGSGSGPGFGPLRAERLGLDEVFLDVSDLVAYNAGLLNRADLAHSFFCLAPRSDPTSGFAYDATAFAGCVTPHTHVHDGESEGGESRVRGMLLDDPLYRRLLVASHLSQHLRLQIEEAGFTSACGIATNKLLAKLVGSANKPRNQTTLLALQEEEVLAFMDAHKLRSVPGIGARTTRILEGYVLDNGKDQDNEAPDGTKSEPDDSYPPTTESAITAGEVRTRADMSPARLGKLLLLPPPGGLAGVERGIGAKVWGLLHGVDPSPVKPASDVPAQISIEDTYGGPRGLTSLEEAARELRRLAASLLRRMHVDLLVSAEDEHDNDNGNDGGIDNNQDKNTDGNEQANPEEAGSSNNSKRKWTARPRTLRLTTRPKTTRSSLSEAKKLPYNYGRASRSAPLPSFVFALGPAAPPREALAARLATETLLPMFRALHPHLHSDSYHGESGLSVGLLNVCVTNMVAVAGVASEEDAERGRDIAGMFRRQEDVLREFTVYNNDDDDGDGNGEDPNVRESVSGGINITAEECRGDDADTGVWNIDNDPATHLITTTTTTTTLGDEVNDDGDENAHHELDSDMDVDVSWWEEDDGGGSLMEACSLCGHLIPLFALSAHERFHRLAEMEGEAGAQGG